MKLRTLLIILLFAVLAGLSAAFVFLFFVSKQTEIAPANVSNAPQIPVIEKTPAPVVKYETDKALQAESDKLLPLFGKMPSVPVYVSDEEIERAGTNVERGVAFTKCESDRKPVIFVKKAFYRKTNKKQVLNILKHELTHAFFCRQGIRAGHDARFRRKFEEVGGFGN